MHSFSKLSTNRLAPPGESSSRRMSWSCLDAHEVPAQLTSFTVASDPIPRIFPVNWMPVISKEVNCLEKLEGWIDIDAIPDACKLIRRSLFEPEIIIMLERQ